MKPPLPPPQVAKKAMKIEEYSSDEDIPLSLRHKVVQAQERAERLKRRKLARDSSSDDSDSSDTMVDRLRLRRRRAARIKPNYVESSPPQTPTPSKYEQKLIFYYLYLNGKFKFK